MLTEQFFKELEIQGCMIQFGTENKIRKSVRNLYDGELEQYLKLFGRKENSYFLAGVKYDENKKFIRAKDEDVIQKNYFYLDLDIRKKHPDLTDEKIKTEIFEWVKATLSETETPMLNAWRYIVYTGNGLHIYFFGEPIKIVDKNHWTLGLGDLISEAEKSFQEEFDRACVNPARLARMPSSMNHKSVPPKSVEILAFRDEKVDLNSILQRGKIVQEKLAVESSIAKAKVQNEYPDKDDTFKAINKIPVSKIICMLDGVVVEPNGKNFTEPHKADRKGYYVHQNSNCLMLGGSTRLPPLAGGYSPFNLVKAYKNYNNFQAFEWFKNTFPEIKKISDAKHHGVQDIPMDYDIKNTFSELRAAEEHQLYLGGHWDDWRLLLRGKVTRIGAMPGTGKSKLGYYLAHRLLNKEYRGIFFTTEVSSADVLAHMLQIKMKKPYLDILEHRVEIPAEIESDFKHLKIFDVKHTGNQLIRMEQIIKKEIDRAEASDMRGLDFIVLDWSQQVTPKSGKYTDIFNWATEWGNQCQEIAQKYDVSFIDVTQLSMKGNKDEDEKYGHVPYEGGNKLLQTADIASMISRDKSLAQNNQVIWDIRKSKSMGRRFRLDLEYEWKTGEFTLVGAQDSRTDGGMSGLHNYRNTESTED